MTCYSSAPSQPYTGRCIYMLLGLLLPYKLSGTLDVCTDEKRFYLILMFNLNKKMLKLAFVEKSREMFNKVRLEHFRIC